MIKEENGKLYFVNSDQKQAIGPESQLNEVEALELFDYVKTHHNLFESRPQNPIESFPFSPLKQEKVVLFPGSFSPWHEGHEACIRNLPAGSEVVIMPDHNPWKEVREGSLWQEAREIWRALAIIKQDCPELSLSLYLGFLGLKQKNPTITWLRNVARKKKWLLMGEDTFLNLHRWTHGDEVLLELDGLYVCPRAKPQDKVLEQRDRLVGDFNNNLKIEFLAPHPYEHYSSTWLRDKAKQS